MQVFLSGSECCAAYKSSFLGVNVGLQAGLPIWECMNVGVQASLPFWEWVNVGCRQVFLSGSG